MNSQSKVSNIKVSVHCVGSHLCMLSAKKALSYQNTKKPPLWTSSCCLLRKLMYKVSLVER